MERPDDRAEKAQADGAGEFGNSISGSFLVSAQGRFAACDQGVGLDFSFGMVTRPTVGALPQTPPEALPLDSARDIVP